MFSINLLLTGCCQERVPKKMLCKGNVYYKFNLIFNFTNSLNCQAFNFKTTIFMTEENGRNAVFIK